MKRIPDIFAILLALTLAVSAPAKDRKKQPAQAEKPQREYPSLQFRADSTFRLLQLTDLHLRDKFPDEEAKVREEIRGLVALEDPDLVVITGDIVTFGKGEPVLRRLVPFLDSLDTPWVVVYGNHDAESGMDRPFMSGLYAEGRNTLNRLNDKGELADLELPILSCSGDPTPGAAPFYLFCMDSNDYVFMEGRRYYSWFTREQIQWLLDCCKARTAEDGRVAPSLAFFHIELLEYIDAWVSRDNPRWRQFDAEHTEGARGENNGGGVFNSGMFAAMHESGSVIGTSCGHAHDSDYIAIYHGIALTYGRYSGGNTVYNHLPPGGRMFVLREGQKGFETWIREYDGRVVRHVRFDGEKLKRAPGKGLPFGTWTEFQTP
jgi:3',5'-cyclic AMP phosphodiesterase CpdA